MDQQQGNQSLERSTARTPEIIRTPDEFDAARKRWQDKKLTLLTPFTHISGLAPQHGIICTVFSFDTSDAAQQVYSGTPWLKGGQVALAKKGLRIIAEALGITTELQHLSVGRERHYWCVKAIAEYKGIDGSTIKREACSEWDLRDGSERLKGFTPNQVSEARKHGLRNCETRAINAAIRECGAGIQQAYRKEDLQGVSFIAPRVTYLPDTSNPETQRQLTEAHLRSSRLLYGGGEAAPRTVDAFADVEDDPQPVSEPRSIGRGSTADSVAPAKAEEKKAEPPCPGAVKIAKTDKREGTSEPKPGQTKGRPYTIYVIVDSNGVEYSTFSKTHYDDAERFKAADEWVEIIAEQNGKHTNIVEIIRAGTEPPLPGMESL